MRYNIKCTDARHVSRENNANSSVRRLWFDGVLATSSKLRKSGDYAEICQGCALANRIDNVPEFRSEKSLGERVKALESR